MFKNLLNKNSIKIEDAKRSLSIKNLKLKIIFFGSSCYVLPIIKILKDNFDLKLVITTEKENGVVPNYCKKNQIQFLSASTLSNPDLKSLILNFKSPVAVLADFGLIIPDSILNAFSKGIINLHPSLLPEYRGPTPVQAAILEGEKTTGISIMKVDSEIDHGPLLGHEIIEISDQDTSETVYKKAFEIGANLLLKLLPKYLNGELKLTAQNHSKATFTKSLTRQNGFIEISKIKNQKLKIARMIRAYSPWPGVWFKAPLRSSSFEGQAKLKIVKLLPFKKIQVEGKKPMNYKDFLNGYPEGKYLIANLEN
jgi:methionyl-tRNA formyltransferase